jgi:hypothetical protein
MSLITGNKVKKTHKPRYCEKEKDKANKRILRSLSFDNNGLIQISPRVKTMQNAWIFFPNFFIEYFSLQTSAKIIHG